MELSTGIKTSKFLNAGIMKGRDVSVIQKVINGVGLGNDFSELVKFQASDPESNANFGWPVCISENRIVVGAWLDDTTAANAGSAYIFDLNGNEIAKVQAFDNSAGNDAEANAYFGRSVDISDNRIVIGAYEKDMDVTNIDAGAVYIYDLNGNQIAKIQSSDLQQGDGFGISVSCNTDRIVVGAYSEDATATDAGSVYIFDINGNQLNKIQASDAEAIDWFGYSVAVSENRIVVGAPNEDSAANNAGSAYIFDMTGTQLAKIQASDAESSDSFGFSVAVSENRIVVGAHLESTNGLTAGSAYIFDIDGNQIAKIQASDAEAGDQFARRVSCSNDKIVIGSYKEGTTVFEGGSVYIFDIDGKQIAKIQSSDVEVGDRFGVSVSCNNSNRIVVGAYGEDDTTPGAGSAYIFDHKMLASTTSSVAGAQESSTTYANLIDLVYDL